MSTDVQTVTFTNIMGQGRVNQLGGIFINGRPLPQHIRLKIIEMATNGVKPCHISRQLRVSHGCVSKILYKYAETGSVSPGQIGGSSRSRKALMAIEPYIAQIYSQEPHLTPTEIRQYLIEKEICSRSNAPTISVIHKYIRNLPLQSSQCRQKPSSAKQLKHSISDILSDCQGESKKLTSSTSNAESKGRKNRTSYTAEQLDILEAAFKANTYPDHELRLKIATATNLDVNKIQVWFSNRRARCRKSLIRMPVNPFLFYPESTPLFMDKIPVPSIQANSRFTGNPSSMTESTVTGLYTPFFKTPF